MVYKNTNGYGLFTFDLDGTLLNSNKEITKENLSALSLAKEAGVELVPSTGRTFKGLPDIIKEMPFRYFILINGALVYDRKEDLTLSSFNIPLDMALDIYSELRAFPILFDSYVDGEGIISEDFLNNIDNLVREDFSKKMIKRLRKPVKDFPGYIKKMGMDVQKISIYGVNDEDVLNAKLHIKNHFPKVEVTSSLSDNAEINYYTATKGRALTSLAEILSIPIDKTIAIGDGSNDSSMIEAAGVGVAMGNAKDDVKKNADFITKSCDESGVAHALSILLKE